MGGNVVAIIILVLIVIVVHIIRAIFRWLVKMATGEGVQRPQVGMHAGAQQGEPPPLIKQFIEQARRQQAQAQQPQPQPEPRHSRRISPMEELQPDIDPDKDLGHYQSKLTKRHLKSSLDSMGNAGGQAPARRASRQTGQRGKRTSKAMPTGDVLFKPTTTTLRQAIILSEIIGKPVALRGRQGRRIPFREPLQRL